MRIKCGTMSYAFRSNLCGSRYEKKRTPRSDSAQRLQKESCRTGRTQTAFNLWLIRRFDRRRSTARRRKTPQRHAAPRVNESSTGSLDALEHFFAARSRAPQPCVPLDVGVFPPLDQRGNSNASDDTARLNGKPISRATPNPILLHRLCETWRDRPPASEAFR
jgi:hypothetical protein